jgi:hypothetical protein
MFIVRAAIVVAIGLTILCAGPARAVLIVDQSQTTFQNGAPIGSAEGQSFTPALASINFATLRLFDAGGAGGSLTVELHLGVNGALLGTSQSRVLPAGFGGTNFTGADAQFDFASPLALIPGSLYSLIIRELSGNFNFLGTGTNAYAGGAAIFGGVAFPLQDAYFIEGINTALLSVSEPNVLLLLALSLLALGMTRRRNRA